MLQSLRAARAESASLAEAARAEWDTQAGEASRAVDEFGMASARMGADVQRRRQEAIEAAAEQAKTAQGQVNESLSSMLDTQAASTKRAHTAIGQSTKDTADGARRQWEAMAQGFTKNIGTMVQGLQSGSVRMSGIWKQLAVSAGASMLQMLTTGQAAQGGAWASILGSLSGGGAATGGSSSGGWLNLALGLIGGMTTGVTGNTAASFGGYRAAGGPVDAGRAYVVGERGPEIVVPRRSGTVLPAQRAAGGDGPSVVVYQNFAQGIQRAELAGIEMRILEESRRGVLDAVRSGGVFRRGMQG
jgi:hypothetical protein